MLEIKNPDDLLDLFNHSDYREEDFHRFFNDNLHAIINNDSIILAINTAFLKSIFTKVKTGDFLELVSKFSAEKKRDIFVNEGFLFEATKTIPLNSLTPVIGRNLVRDFLTDTNPELVCALLNSFNENTLPLFLYDLEFNTEKAESHENQHGFSDLSNLLSNLNEDIVSPFLFAAYRLLYFNLINGTFTLCELHSHLSKHGHNLALWMDLLSDEEQHHVFQYDAKHCENQANFSYPQNVSLEDKLAFYKKMGAALYYDYPPFNQNLNFVDYYDAQDPFRLKMYIFALKSATRLYLKGKPVSTTNESTGTLRAKRFLEFLNAMNKPKITEELLSCLKYIADKSNKTPSSLQIMIKEALERTLDYKIALNLNEIINHLAVIYDIKMDCEKAHGTRILERQSDAFSFRPVLTGFFSGFSKNKPVDTHRVSAFNQDIGTEMTTFRLN